MTTNDVPLLTVDNVTKHFGGLTALSKVSFAVEERSIFGLIGPNGSGKTTLFNVIGGQLRSDGGRVLLQEQEITAAAPERVAAKGIARTFQIPRLFRGLSVRENVMVAAHLRGRAGVIRSAVRIPPIRQEERRIRTIADEVLEFTGLGGVAGHLAGVLSSGQARLLEVARALATGPRLLMLDEPAAGLSFPEAQSLGHVVTAIRDSGVTVLLVEHNMAFVMELCDRLAVLSNGTKIAEDVPDVVRHDQTVIDAYLGRTA